MIAESPMERNEFEVGEVVTIVDKPYAYCPFHWVPSMNQYLSRQATVVSKRLSAVHHEFMYRIDIDGDMHNWCGNCFVAKETPEFNVASEYDIGVLLGV